MPLDLVGDMLHHLHHDESVPWRDRSGGLAGEFLTARDLEAMPSLSPLIEGVLDLDTVALLYGPRGCYKSFLALDWCLTVATGGSWADRRAKPSSVLYVAAEGVAGLRDRLWAWSDERDVDVPDRFRVLRRPINLLAGPEVDQLADACLKHDMKFVVLDTLARCFVGGDENSAKDAGVAVDNLDRLRRRTGACVLIVHHSGKNADSGARGSTAFEAAADSVFRLKAEEGRARLQCTKQKNMVGDFSARFDPVERGESVVLRWHPQVGTVARRTRPTLSTRERVIRLALDAGSDGITASGVIEITGKASSTVYRYLTDGVNDGRLINTDGRYGPASTA